MHYSTPKGVDDDDGTVTLQDRYTDDSMNRPSLDDMDHLTLIEGEQEDGITRIRFQRTRSVDCDDSSGHDLAVSQGTSRVIYAWNDQDGDADDADSIRYHGTTQRGSQSVNLWYGESGEVELEDDVDFIDLTMTNWSVSSEDTTYICKLFELPIFEETQHVVMFEPIVEEGNEGTVHHVTFYSCPEDRVNGTVLDTHAGVCDEWHELNMPSEDCRDSRLEYAWAIGGKAQYYPKVAGLPMSGDSNFHYVFMVMHYDVEYHLFISYDFSGIIEGMFLEYSFVNSYQVKWSEFCVFLESGTTFGYCGFIGSTNVVYTHSASVRCGYADAGYPKRTESTIHCARHCEHAQGILSLGLHETNTG